MFTKHTPWDESIESDNMIATYILSYYNLGI